MRTVTLVPSGIRTSRLGYGTASLHHLIGSPARQAALGAAFDAGVRYFDTAPLYGHELAERELGNFLRGRRSEVTLVTKVGIEPTWLYARSSALLYVSLAARRALNRLHLASSPRYERRDFTPATVRSRVQRSLRLLRTDCIDALLLHEPALEQIRDPEALLESLDRLREAGSIRYFGLAGDAQECLRIVARAPALAQWLQVDCSAGPRSVLALHEQGLAPQVTFGHFRSAAIGGRLDVGACFREAMQANPAGVILFSSRDPVRIRQTIAVADRAESA